MPEPENATWSAKPHTLAKHRILQTYLQAWFPILSRTVARQPGPQREILYVDGFAGPGVYADGEPGSPIIALRTAIEHRLELPSPIRFLFIERDPARFESLKRELSKITQAPHMRTLEPRLGDCCEILTEMLDRMGPRARYFGPALVFLDQFGYSGVPMHLVRRLMEIPSCEVFLLINYQRLAPYLTDPTKEATIDAAFGTDAWRCARGRTGASRLTLLLETYKRALAEQGNVPYVLGFAMCDVHGNLIYWLFFCTQSLRGIEEMKRAMWKVDDRGTYRFSDREGAGQDTLLEQFDDRWLAAELGHRLAGRAMRVGAVKKHVLLETPCYRFRSALVILEKAGSLEILNPPPGRRRATFPSMDLIVRFADRSRPGSSDKPAC